MGQCNSYSHAVFWQFKIIQNNSWTIKLFLGYVQLEQPHKPFIRQLSGSHHAVIVKSSGRSQVVIRQSSGSHQIVFKQLSGSLQAVFWQFSGSLQAVVKQFSGSLQLLSGNSINLTPSTTVLKLLLPLFCRNAVRKLKLSACHHYHHRHHTTSSFLW